MTIKQIATKIEWPNATDTTIVITLAILAIIVFVW